MMVEVVRYQLILFGISTGRYLGVRKNSFDNLSDASSAACGLITSPTWLGYVIIKHTPNWWAVDASYRQEYVEVVDGNLVASNLFKNTRIDPEKS
jgi:hypothetical protein